MGVLDSWFIQLPTDQVTKQSEDKTCFFIVFRFAKGIDENRQQKPASEA
jgi:hypothetical protein